MARKKNYIENASVSVDINFADTTNTYPNINSRFTIKKTSVMTHEQVANMFKFDKELILSKFNQLDMLPIAGYFVDGEATSHNSKAVPYGAVMPNSARFEVIDGEEYLVVDSCLWSGRYPEVRDVSSMNQSMEITNVQAKYNKELGYYEVSDYTFDCICMLNQNTSPAFKKARMDVDANFNDDFETFKAEFAEMLQDINKNVQEIGSDELGNKKEFTLIELGQIWETIWNQLAEKYPDTDGYCSIYRIEGIYEETSNSSKFVLLRKRETQELYKVNLEIDENGVKLGDEATLVVEVVIETGEVTKFEEPENVEKYKEFIKMKDEQSNEEPNDEPQPEFNDEPNNEPIENPIDETSDEPIVNYEELYKELQNKFNEMVIKCSDLETEIVPLRQFKAEIEEKENKVKAEMELKEKNDLIESFATKLSKQSIEGIIDDVNKFTLDEIKMKLSIALADQILANEKKDDAEFSNVIINIDNMNKKVSREERLIEEIKNKRNKKTI